MQGLQRFGGILLLILVIILTVERLGHVSAPQARSCSPELDDYDSDNSDCPTENYTELTNWLEWRRSSMWTFRTIRVNSETANKEPVPRFPVELAITEPNQPGRDEVHIRRTFSGGFNDTWFDFLQYVLNVAELNLWGTEKSRRVLMSTLRGQAETYVYDLPLAIPRS